MRETVVLCRKSVASVWWWSRALEVGDGSVSKKSLHGGAEVKAVGDRPLFCQENLGTSRLKTGPRNGTSTPVWLTRLHPAHISRHQCPLLTFPTSERCSEIGVAAQPEAGIEVEVLPERHPKL